MIPDFVAISVLAVALTVFAIAIVGEVVKVPGDTPVVYLRAYPSQPGEVVIEHLGGEPLQASKVRVVGGEVVTGVNGDLFSVGEEIVVRVAPPSGVVRVLYDGATIFECEVSR